MPTRAFRIFLVNAKGKIKRFPCARYSRLFQENSSEALPELAGTWARFAELIVETEGRKPVRVMQAFYPRTKIGSDGRPDPEAQRILLRLSIGTVEPDMEKETNVIQGRPYWAKKKMNEQFKWKPTPAEEKAIRRLALGR